MVKTRNKSNILTILQGQKERHTLLKSQSYKMTLIGPLMIDALDSSNNFLMPSVNLDIELAQNPDAITCMYKKVEGHSLKLVIEDAELIVPHVR